MNRAASGLRSEEARFLIRAFRGQGPRGVVVAGGCRVTRRPMIDIYNVRGRGMLA